jgi:NAD+ kinase
MLTDRFKTTALIIRQESAPHVEQIRAICDTLAGFGEVLVHSIDGGFDCGHATISNFEQIGERADLAVSVGGDGTLLTAARNLVDYGIPLVGINLGRLGFLADVTIDDMHENLRGIFAGNYSVEKRFLLDGEIMQQGQETISHLAVNDIILHSHQNIRMIEFEVYSDGQLINKQRADGLIVSSPTGSTAYSLSGGGPIMHPSLNALALVPICPHTLSQRPIVLPSEQKIEIQLNQPGAAGLLSFDGHSRAVLQCGDRIVVTRHEKNITLLHPAGYDYFHILRAKLKWSNQP